MDYFTRLHFCDLDWRLYTRFSSGTTTTKTTKSDEPLAHITTSTSDNNNNVHDDDDRDTTGIWKLCLNNYKHSVKFEATVHAKSDQTVHDLKAYLNEIFTNGNIVVYEFYSSSKTEMPSSQLIGSEQFSSLVQKLTICLPSTDFQLRFDRVEFNEREEASVERTIYMMKSGSDKNEINELKQQMEEDRKKNEQLERKMAADSKKIDQLELQAKQDAESMAEMKKLIDELKLFRDEALGKRQRKKQQRSAILAPFVNILRANSVLVSDNDDYVEHLAKWMLKVGYKLHSRLFRASTDGFTSANCHSKCDNKGATLTIVKAGNGRLFGGFTVNPWSQSNTWSNTNGDKAWLFSLNSTTGPIRFKCINHSQVQYNSSSYGPAFGGGHDLCMYLIPITHPKHISSI